MTMAQFAKRVEKFSIDNSPMLLTAVGVTGTITTAILAGKASYRAGEMVRDMERTAAFQNPPLEVTTRDRLELIWKLYIPAVGVGSTTIVAIVASNRIGTRRAAAMAAAYTVSERAFTEYREKIIEKVGETKERAARDEIAQESVTKNPPPTMILSGAGQVICKDAWSGRYWPCDMETIKKAQNDTNHEVLNQGYASLTDLYSRLGLEPTKESDEVGWNSDKLLDIFFTTTISEEQQPVLVMDFSTVPVRNFFRTH